jgi:hypothetical protein
VRAALEDELQELLAETNEQRRRVGQALFHFYRSLVFWRERGRTFFQIAAAWSAGGSSIFEALTASLRRLSPHGKDAALRAYLSVVLAQLAGDLERGDHMLVPFLRWIEGRFPELTAKMQQESPETRINDVDLAEGLAVLFGRLARTDRAEGIRLLRDAARATWLGAPSEE